MDVVKALIAAGADVSFADHNGMTALIVRPRLGWLLLLLPPPATCGAVRLPVDNYSAGAAGANLEVKSNEGATAMVYAKQFQGEDSATVAALRAASAK